MAKNKPVVSQSRTMWVKKGQKLSDGTVAKKGYLAQYGKDTKKVSARVQMVQQTGGVAKGDTQVYKNGKRRTPMMKPESTDKPKSESKPPASARAKSVASSKSAVVSGRPKPQKDAEKPAKAEAGRARGMSKYRPMAGSAAPARPQGSPKPGEYQAGSAPRGNVSPSNSRYTVSAGRGASLAGGSKNTVGRNSPQGGSAKPRPRPGTVSAGRGGSVSAGSKPAAKPVAASSIKVGTIRRTPTGRFRWNGKAWAKIG